MNHSVTHDNCPEKKKGFTRGISIRSGYLIRRDPENPTTDSILIYVAQADPKGSIPSWVVNMGTKTFAPSVIANLIRVSGEYPVWKAAHEPENKPWLTNDPYWWENQGS